MRNKANNYEAKRGNGFITRMFFIFAVMILAFSMWNMKKILDDYRTSDVSYENARETYVQEKPVEDDEPGVHIKNVEKVVDFDSLQSINPDVIGWISINGSNIDYPIMKSKDNQDYLHTTFDKQYASAGSIFMDCRNSDSFDDYNTIIYGHNMKNGSMFHDLKKYLDEKASAEISKEVDIYLPDGSIKKYSIISIRLTDAFSDSYQLSFDSLDAYEIWLNGICKTSQIVSEYDAHKPTLTLSTCRGAQGGTERLVVHLQPVD